MTTRRHREFSGTQRHVPADAVPWSLRHPRRQSLVVHLSRSFLTNGIPSYIHSTAPSKSRRTPRCRLRPRDIARTRVPARARTHTHTYARTVHPRTAADAGTHGTRGSAIFTSAVPRSGARCQVHRLQQVSRRARARITTTSVSAGYADFAVVGELRREERHFWTSTGTAPRLRCVDECSTCVSSLNRHGDPSPSASPAARYNRLVGPWGPPRL